MATFKGTIKKSDLEGGIWQLHADDGEVYQIRGGDDGLRKEGQQVQVDGKVDEGGFGIGMSGPYLDVEAWKAK